MNKTPIQNIKHKTLSSPKFLNFVHNQLKRIYNVNTVNIGRFSIGTFIGGHDLLAFYFTFVSEYNYLPEEITLYHGANNSKEIQGCNNIHVDGDVTEEVISKSPLNCFQASFSIYTGVVKGSTSFSHFLNSRQIEIDDLADVKTALSEAIMAAQFKTLYSDIYVEVHVLIIGIITFDYVSYEKKESRDLKLFFAKILTTNRSKSIKKINRLIEYKNIFRLLALKSAYNINEFDNHIKKSLTYQDLEKIEALVQIDYISNYVMSSDEPAHKTFSDLCKLYPYYRDYPKAMEKIHNYFEKNNLGALTKEKVQTLLENPESRKNIGEYFDIPKKPLDTSAFTSDNPNFEVAELLSSL